MPNIASVLKEEVVRLARKEVRREIEGLKKATATYRSEIAELKRRATALEKQVGKLETRSPRKAVLKAEVEPGSRLRFSAKRLAAQRQKSGLSAADMGLLLGVSAQTVYHWESGKTRPRPQQLAAIAALRKVGKREAKALLEKLKA